MAKLSLRNRLLLSHVLVMLVGVIGLTVIDEILHPRLFVRRLEIIQQQGLTVVKTVQLQVVRELKSSKTTSTFWSLLVGTSAAAALSVWVTKRITKPLTAMEQVTQRFAEGQLDERMAGSDIPEVDSLSTSFNRMADSIQDIERRRRDLVGDLTHELRTPLTIVGGYLEELADNRLQPSPELYLKLIHETRRLERLVNDLQELSKAEAGYLPLHLEAVSLLPLLQSLIDFFQDQLPDRDPVLAFDAAATVPAVWCDRDRIKQVLVNLLGNAIQHTIQGQITLKVWQDRDRVWLAVQDTGTGIAPDDLPHIFERFWRSGQSRSRYSEGSGIGLAIAHKLVHLHGSRLEVDSTLGQGTQFQFWLPIVT